jgi:sugar-specific transcriptional regulator TrmB
METKLLEQAGLNPTQAKAYIALITSGSLTPPQLATKVGITRTNAYEVLKQLSELELAITTGVGTKLAYRANNPASLEKLMEHRRSQIMADENRLHQLMPQLMTYFYTHSEQPGVRFYQGLDGLTKIYEDILRTRQTLYMVRTPAERATLGKDIVQKFIAQRIKLGIPVEAITPYTTSANKDPQVDAIQNFTRTFMPAGAYTDPVEIDIYGNKVAFLSFGQELTGTIIESPQIANAMRAAFIIMKTGAEQLFAASPGLAADLTQQRAELAPPDPAAAGQSTPPAPPASMS